MLLLLNTIVAPMKAFDMMPHIEGGDVKEHLRERVLGRVVAEDVLKPGTEEVLIPA